MNDKQKALLSIAVQKTLDAGSGIVLDDRPLKAGEFAPIESKHNSGGVIFSTQSIPQEVCQTLGLAFLPVVDHDGREQLALCLHGENYKLVTLARVDAKAAGGLISDLMLSAAQYTDPTTQADVVKAVTDAVLASDLQVKESLCDNSESAMQNVFAKMIAKRMETAQRHFDATIAEIERSAQMKAAQFYQKQLLELAEIASVDQTSIRRARLSEMMPEIKAMQK